MSNGDWHSAVPTRVVNQVMWRLLPPLTAMFAMAQLARFNVSFAANSMGEDLGFGESVYGLGAGLFFIGYLALQVPINLIVPRVGARRVFFFIMISWGAVSCATAFVGSAAGFYTVRLLLGAAQSGLYGAIVLYLTYWVPTEQRATAMGVVALSLPISGFFGAPMSGAIIDNFNNVAGLQGWQWMFVAEGLPVVLFAPLLCAVLTNTPDRANWLSLDERRVLVMSLTKGTRSAVAVLPSKASRVLSDSNSWLMAVMYLLLAGAASGGMFWLPKAISATLGASSQLAVGWLVGVPYLAFALSGVLWGRSSDRRNERRWHMSIASVVCGIGLLLTGVSDSITEMLVAILIFNIGFAGSFAVAWNLVTVVIRKELLPIGVAFVSSAGAVGSFLCVTCFGVAIEMGVSYSFCFGVLCGLLVLAAICGLLSRDPGCGGRTLLDGGR